MSKLKNEIGNRYGKLVVIERAENNNRGEAQWLCRCDCGCEKVVRANDLRSGRTISCGCLHNNGKDKKIQIGDKYNYLTVLEETSERDHSFIVYKCRCDCGNIILANANALRTGHTQSCGCIKSRGEKKISQILRDNNIPFEIQKTFEDCKDALPLPFDFWVCGKYVIEYDGIQHFETKDNHGWNTLENQKKLLEHDELKNQYCKEHGIPIIRIPYTKYDTLCLEDLLLKEGSIKNYECKQGT